MQLATLLAASEIQDRTAALVVELQPIVVQVRSRRGGGSGIVWKSSGEIVTNHHVVPSDHVEIETSAGERFAATVAKRDQANDLAVLTPAEGAPSLGAARIGDSRALRVGQLVLAIGHPFGVRGAVTSGIIQSVHHREGNRELLKADIELRPGNSGGPLITANGEVIGVNSMIVGPGLALAVPSHIVEQLLRKPAAKLGLAAREVQVRADVVKAAGLADDHAVMVVEIAPDGAAAASGLMQGDIVVGLNGAKIQRLQDFAGKLQQRSPDADVRLTVVRGGAVQDIVVLQRAA